MSTTPTQILDTASLAQKLDIDSIKATMDGFDPATLLPDLQKLFDSLAPVCKFAVMIGPILLLIFGACYLFLAPKEANWYFGYRCYFGMGSEYAWRSTQRMAGLLFGGLGLALTVIMFIITGRFAYMEVTAMVWQALECMVLEAVLTLLAVLSINLTAFFRFNRKGQHRRKHRR